MRPDVFEVIGYGSLILLVAYLAFYFWRVRKAPKTPAPSDVNAAHIEALRENSELLRELIAVNRQLLEKQDRNDA